MTERFNRGYIIAFAIVIGALILALAIRSVLDSPAYTVQLLLPSGETRTISLRQIKALPALTRKGVYENQFGNWRDEGIYTGLKVADLIGADIEYTTLVVAASDGYTMQISRSRVEDPEYPLVLAYAFDGIEIPAWSDGPRIAVLPEDGDVSNAEYDTDSAGSFWVKNVITLTPR